MEVYGHLSLNYYFMHVTSPLPKTSGDGEIFQSESCAISYNMMFWVPKNIYKEVSCSLTETENIPYE